MALITRASIRTVWSVAQSRGKCPRAPPRSYLLFRYLIIDQTFPELDAEHTPSGVSGWISTAALDTVAVIQIQVEKVMN